MPQKKAIEETKVEGKDMENLVIELAKQGLTSEKIGLKLKERGANIKDSNTKIGIILKKHNLFQNPDIKNLTTRVERMKKHLAKNKHDHNMKRALLIRGAKLYKLKKLLAKEE